MSKRTNCASVLTKIILHDVKRLDRLISDISDASRLDAELAREEYEPMDIATLLGNIIPAFNDIRRDKEIEVTLMSSTKYSAVPMRS